MTEFPLMGKQSILCQAKGQGLTCGYTQQQETPKYHKQQGLMSQTTRLKLCGRVFNVTDDKVKCEFKEIWQGAQGTRNTGQSHD